MPTPPTDQAKASPIFGGFLKSSLSRTGRKIHSPLCAAFRWIESTGRTAISIDLISCASARSRQRTCTSRNARHAVTARMERYCLWKIVTSTIGTPTPGTWTITVQAVNSAPAPSSCCPTIWAYITALFKSLEPTLERKLEGKVRWFSHFEVSVLANVIV